MLGRDSLGKAVGIVKTTIQRHTSKANSAVPGDICLAQLPYSKKTTPRFACHIEKTKIQALLLLTVSFSIVFARLIKVSLSHATLSFSPEELDTDIVSWTDVQVLSDDMQQMLSTAGGLSSLVINPFDRFWQGMAQCLNDEIHAHLRAHGAAKAFSFVMPDNVAPAAEALSVLDLPMLLKARILLQDLFASPQPIVEKVSAVKVELTKR